MCSMPSAIVSSPDNVRPQFISKTASILVAMKLQMVYPAGSGCQRLTCSSTSKSGPPNKFDCNQMEPYVHTISAPSFSNAAAEARRIAALSIKLSHPVLNIAVQDNKYKPHACQQAHVIPLESEPALPNDTFVRCIAARLGALERHYYH